MHRGVVAAANNSNTQMAQPQPQAKRLRGEDLYLPGQQQQQAQTQLGGAIVNVQQQQQQHSISLGGGIASNGNNNNATITAQQQQQQQMALAQSASGVGALSGRLGFTLPNNIAAAANNTGLISGIVGGGAAGSGSTNNHMMGQQQQQANNTANTNAGVGAMINLPIGMGMKFGTGGNIMPTQPVGVAGIGMQQANVVGGAVGLANGNAMATNGVMNNHAAIAAAGIGNTNAAAAHLATQQHGGGILSGMAGQVAVTNMQYGITPSTVANPLHQIGMGMIDKGHVEDQMAAERRLRNREHAKRSRVRKKFMLEGLQQQVRGLQDENSCLRMLVQKHIPKEALKIIDECCSKSVLFDTSGGDWGGEDGSDAGNGPQDAKKEGGADSTPLLRSDFSLIESLTSGQQNFVLSDPRLPDNPIVFASPGFYELTGYTREQVLGRNCRFLQGAGTDRKAIEVIRTAVANGTDATVCLLNYKADGTPFWNQLFVAALRDADNCIVNYVGVQTMIEPNAGASALEDKVNAAHPISIGAEDDDDNDKDANK